MLAKKHFVAFFIIAVIVFSCRKSDDIDIIEFIGFEKPKHFPEPIYNFSSSNITKETFELGKKLFYDPILSRDNTISCGSCHISQNAFTHHGHDVSHGIDDQLGTRNTMPLMNLAWSPYFFWDGGVHDLDLSPIAPIENPIEMDENMNNVVEKLKSSKQYFDLFKAAFGDSEINTSRILKSISHFMLMMTSANSKYDQVKSGKYQFTDNEDQGYKIFKQHCASCHQEPLFTDYSFRDNGIGINPANDLGRYTITNDPSDKLKFKVPSLRNLKYTMPYMHDGRFYTIRAVINHYINEIQNTPNLDPLLKNSKAIKLDENEINNLIAFLNTLNDEEFINNKIFEE